MAKKKSAKTSADPVGEPAAPRSNSAIVREILNSGVTKPAEIIQIALEKYEMNISPGLVNQVKMAIKKKQGSAVTKLNKAPRKVAKVVRYGTEVRGGKKAQTPDAHSVGNPRPTELDVAKFALKMGGVDAAIAALRDLVK